MKIALIGNPNSGKTSLFNVLTGSRQHTGNYAGVTVEKKEGEWRTSAGTFHLLDLPGIYSMHAQTLDESIAIEVLQGKREQLPDAVIAVADCTQLQRHLYLILQIIELGYPLVIALTMSDLAPAAGLSIDADTLEKELGAPVVLVSSLNKKGLDQLENRLTQLAARSDEMKCIASVDLSNQALIGRYQKIDDILKKSIQRIQPPPTITQRIDAVLLHPIFGPALLFFIFLFLFQTIFWLAEYPMNAIEGGIAWLQEQVSTRLADSTLRSLLVDGVLAGVGAVVVFLPQILILFAFLLFFEDSGYMARVAFILDRLMRSMGLPGRAFIPLLSSFACAIPGIMATRTIENRRDRIVTMLIAPLMTCSARIPVYTMLIAAFIPDVKVFYFLSLQGLVLFGLYLLGIVFGFIVAFVLKKFFLKAERQTFIFELPSYKWPVWRNIGLGLWDRGWIFVKKAGTVILLLSMVLWMLTSFPQVEAPPQLAQDAARAYQLEHSFAGQLGKFMEPALTPLGFDWRIGIALIASFAAREVLLSALGTVFALGSVESDASSLISAIQGPTGFGFATAISLLVFYALACQCMSTLAIVRRESNSWKWPSILFIYMTTLAYVCSLLTYQGLKFFGVF